MLSFLSQVWKCTEPGLQAKKKREYHKYKKNIAMADCVVILFSSLKAVWYIFFIYGILGFFFPPAARA